MPQMREQELPPQEEGVRIMRVRRDEEEKRFPESKATQTVRWKKKLSQP